MERSRSPSPGLAAWRRARLVDATIELLREDGLAKLTATAIIERAGVSRKAFYDIFRDTEDCLLAALEHVLQRLEQPVRAARRSQADWLEGVRRALAVALITLDQDRALGRILLLHSLNGGPRTLARRAQVLELLAVEVTPPGDALERPEGQIVALITAGGIAELLANRVAGKQSQSLISLHGSIMSMIVLPHEGRRAAQLERGRRPPELPATAHAGEGAAEARRALHGMQTRLTYRTVRVLDAIAVAPGASNREIAQTAGITDQGQISKLLKRLTGLGLIENRGSDRPTRAANSWWLTDAGAAMQRGAGGARMLSGREQ